MTVMLVLLRPEIPLEKQDKIAQEEKLDRLIREKIEEILSEVFLNQKDGEIAYQVFMAIHNDPEISKILPPGAQLSGKSTLIKDIIKEKLPKLRG